MNYFAHDCRYADLENSERSPRILVSPKLKNEKERNKNCSVFNIGKIIA